MVSTPAANLRDYWRDRLDGALCTEFPADLRRDPQSERSLREEWVVLPADRLPADLPLPDRFPDDMRHIAPAAADRQAAEAAMAQFATMLAAWYAVLHRHTGQADLLVGTRLQAEADGTPAPGGKQCIVLPLRAIINPTRPFTELAEQARDTVVGAFRHARDCAGTGLGSDPPISVGITLASMIPPDKESGGTVPGMPFDLELIVRAADARTDVRLVYDASRFTRSTAVRLLRHLARFAAEARRAPATPVRRLPVEDEPASAPPWPLEGPGELAEAESQSTQSLVDAFRAIAARYPDRMAVRGPSGAYQYAGLDRSSTVLAATLSRLAGEGERVALLCEHDIGIALGIWSVLKAGAAYVPLDPRQPDGRLARILADARVAAIVCDERLARRATALARRTAVVPLPGPDADAGGPLPALSPVDPSALAYLLHTSGTTGGPKAVMQTHANVLGHARAYARRIASGPDDRVPLLARFTFDLAVVDFFATLLTGGSLHIMDPLAPAPDVWRDISAAGATILHCTPTHYRHLLSGLAASEGPAGKPGVAPASLRAVVLGGERVTRDDLQAFLFHFPERCVLVSGLSATECSVALQHLSSRADLAAAVLPVGHPVDGVRVRLVDDDGMPTEIFGELEIASDRVALGYWDRPEATAAAFGEHPDGVRFYRTRDLARRRPDGALVHCGRKDRQVKIRGHRVEPSEIEAMLRLHPTVAQAAVVFGQRTGSPCLIAYATSATTVPLDIAELAGYLTRQLPDYAVPDQIVALNAMPVGPTGKLDYGRLPIPAEEVPAPSEEPRPGLETAVARIWSDVLGLTRISARATFMASGGDSVRLMAMMARLRDDLRADIPLIDILQNPTVVGIAGLIERARAS
jgi:amino acid adenylation domain-containing protein